MCHFTDWLIFFVSTLTAFLLKLSELACYHLISTLDFVRLQGKLVFCEVAKHIIYFFTVYKVGYFSGMVDTMAKTGCNTSVVMLMDY